MTTKPDAAYFSMTVTATDQWAASGLTTTDLAVETRITMHVILARNLAFVIERSES